MIGMMPSQPHLPIQMRLVPQAMLLQSRTIQVLSVAVSGSYQIVHNYITQDTFVEHIGTVTPTTTIGLDQVIPDFLQHIKPWLP
jgi:hypothetical protein